VEVKGQMIKQCRCC